MSGFSFQKKVPLRKLPQDSTTRPEPQVPVPAPLASLAYSLQPSIPSSPPPPPPSPASAPVVTPEPLPFPVGHPSKKNATYVVQERRLGDDRDSFLATDIGTYNNPAAANTAAQAAFRSRFGPTHLCRSYTEKKCYGSEELLTIEAVLANGQSALIKVFPSNDEEGPCFYVYSLMQGKQLLRVYANLESADRELRVWLVENFGAAGARLRDEEGLSVGFVKGEDGLREVVRVVRTHVLE